MPEANDPGNKRLHTWSAGAPHTVTMDFLISPTDHTNGEGAIHHNEFDLVATVTREYIFQIGGDPWIPEPARRVRAKKKGRGGLMPHRDL